MVVTQVDMSNLAKSVKPEEMHSVTTILHQVIKRRDEKSDDVLLVQCTQFHVASSE